MPWKAALQSGDLREVILDLLKILLPVVGIIMNNVRLRQLQEHVRCDDECIKQHSTNARNRRRPEGRRR